MKCNVEVTCAVTEIIRHSPNVKIGLVEYQILKPRFKPFTVSQAL